MQPRNNATMQPRNNATMQPRNNATMQPRNNATTYRMMFPCFIHTQEVWYEKARVKSIAPT